jgi:hypothetical protein
VSARRGGIGPLEWGLLGLLVLWALVPLAVIIAHAAGHHERLTGADGLIGSDQLQYLSWARDAGSHGLAANLFDLAPSSHVFAEPMFTLTGGLWRLGVPLPLAYWLWKPVAIAVLFAGAAAWASRMLPGRWPRAAAVALSLFLFTPAGSLVAWFSVGSSHFRGDLSMLAAEMLPAGELWGYLPSAIAVGLMPIALLAIDRAGDGGRAGSRAGPLAIAAGAGLLVAWLHPWQGLVLLLMLIGLAVWQRLRDWRVLGVPALATALPLAYYGLLSHYDSAWHLASRNEIVPHLSTGVLVAGLVPILVLAAAGLRRPSAEPLERALVLWIPVTLVTYFAVGSFPTHAFESASLPLAVLIVRGAMRLRIPAVVAVVALALLTLPGVARDIKGFVDVERSQQQQQFYLTSPQSHALDWMRRDAPPGGVLAQLPLGIAVPSQTGRPVWVGHQFWSRDYAARFAVTNRLFAGAVSPTSTRQIVTGSGARLVLSDCGAPSLTGALRPLLESEHHFGCATVYVLRPGSSER